MEAKKLIHAKAHKIVFGRANILDPLTADELKEFNRLNDLHEKLYPAPKRKKKKAQKQKLQSGQLKLNLLYN